MKKHFCLFLFFTFLPVFCFADNVLKDGWWTADLDELLSARENLDIMIQFYESGGMVSDVAETPFPAQPDSTLIPAPTSIPDTPIPVVSPTPVPDTPIPVFSPTPVPDTPIPVISPTPVPDTPIPIISPTPIPDTPISTPVPILPQESTTEVSDIIVPESPVSSDMTNSLGLSSSSTSNPESDHNQSVVLVNNGNLTITLTGTQTERQGHLVQPVSIVNKSDRDFIINKVDATINGKKDNVWTCTSTAQVTSTDYLWFSLYAAGIKTAAEIESISFYLDIMDAYTGKSISREGPFSLTVR